MAACPPIDGDSLDSDNFVSTPSLQTPKVFPNNSQIKSSSSRGNSKDYPLDSEEAYDKVASFEEAALKKLLEEVVCQKQNKNDKSAIAQLLIKKEEDALREESGSGEDTTEQRLKRQKKKKSICRKDHCVSHLGCSAAARNNTGGSLGSLQNLTDQKVPEQTNTNTQGVAARSRAGGSCGNLSKGSFETHTCKRRSRRSKEINRASTSQREGGSLQNLSKTEAASNEAKKLHKSGSLSQVFSDVGGVRLKNRRQKTSSESSSTRTFTRRSEDREPPESSEDEVGEFPYTRLPPSSHSSVSGHSCDTGENLVVMVGGGRWNGDHMSDVASGETTEEDGESSMHVTARAKLGDSSRHHHHDGSDNELHSVISHTAHRDVLPTISSDSEVDKPVNFGLCKNQEEAMSSSTSLPYTSVKSVFETKTTSKDDEVNEKRKLRNSKSENGSYEKSSYDENGNSVFMSVRSSLSGGNSGSSISSNCSSSSTTTTTTTTGAPIYSSVSCNDRHSSSSLAVGSSSSSKKNSYTPVNNSKDGSNYNRLKAKQDKKKAIKEKEVMQSEKTPGFRGSDPLDAILKFLGAENSTNSKSKKKNKSKKEEDKDGARNRKTKSLDKTSTEDSDFENIRFDDNFGKTKYEDDGNNVNDIKERKDEEGRRNKKNQDKKRGKKGSGLRESSSVEDLVSKSKQINDVKEVRKHVTVDDGELSPFHCHSSSKSNYSLENKAKSEFSCDFYKVGDALLESEPASIESGDFEIVSRKKGKKARNSSTSTYNSTTVSQGSRVGGSSGSWTSSTNYSSTYTSDDQRRATFPRSNPTPRNSSSKTSSQDKPQINFSEGPFTVHDGVFLSQFSGNRSSAGGERYTTTTSVPHSEDSDSDGGDSVHSMPAHVITPRPHVRKPPPSTDSTPQASYANIAKLAAVSTSKSQTKKNCTVNPSGNPVGVSEEENHQANEEPVPNQQEPKVKLPSSILDDFPPLIGGTSSSAGGAINNNNSSSNSSSSNNNSASVINSENINNNPSVGILPQDSSFPVVKDLKILNYSSDANVGEITVKTPSFSNSSGICNSSSSGSSNMSFTVNETTNSTSKLQHNNNLSKYTSTSVSQCSFVEPLSHYASNNNNNNNTNNNFNNNNNTPIISNKPVVPHTQPHIEQQPKQKQPSPPHQKQQPTVIYNTALSQKLSQHTQSLKFINQSIKSNNKSKVACSLTSAMQHQPISINYSSNKGNSVVKSERNKNTVPKEKTNNVNYNLKSSKTKDSTETSSGGNNIKNNKRYEAAVIFTDNAKFDLTNFEIEFGFDVTLENLTNLTDNVVESPSFTNTSVISNDTTINIKNLISDTTNTTTAAATTVSNNNKSKNFHPPVDFSKFYQAPVNDVISYNYEELCRHVYKGWESVLQMLEEDPKNIQYWKATDGDGGNNNTVKN